MSVLPIASQAFSLYRLIHGLSPDSAVVVGTLGALLLLVEFNRPGRVLPAALGLLFVLLAASILLQVGVQPWPALLLMAAIAVMLWNVYRSLPAWLLALGVAIGIVALRFLVSKASSTEVHTVTAVACGGLLGVISAVLGRIAYRARRAKALN